MRSKNNKENGAIKHIGRAQSKKKWWSLISQTTHYETFTMEAICCPAWQCSCCRINFRLHNNHVFQELLLKLDYFCSRSDEKIYIDLWDSLGYTDEIVKPSRYDSKLNVIIELQKFPCKKKQKKKTMSLRVWGYTNNEYLYMLTDGSLTLKHKTYIIKLLDNVLEAWEEPMLNAEFGI